MFKIGIGDVDLVEVLKYLPTDPNAQISLIILCVTALLYRLLPTINRIERLIAIFLVLVAGGFAIRAVQRQRDGALEPPSAKASSPTVETAASEQRTRTESFYDRNPHCARDRTVRWPVATEAGWRIVVASIRPKVTVKSSRSRFRGVVNSGDSGFSLEGRIENNGSCGPFWKDARGALGVSVTFTEVRP